MSGGCARGFVTSSNPSAWPWQQRGTTRSTGYTLSTALHGARAQPPGPGEGERVTSRSTGPSSGRLSLPSRSSSSCARKSPAGCGQGQSRTLSRRSGCSGTQWSTSSTSVFVRILDVSVPQVGNQHVEFMQWLDTSTPVPVIAVPKISQDRIPPRFVDCHCRVFLLSAAADCRAVIDIPVPRTRGDHGGLQGFPPRQGSLQRTVEQAVDIPVGGGLQDFLPDPGLPPSAVSREEPGQGCFRTFPVRKKVRRSPGVRGCPRT